MTVVVLPFKRDGDGTGIRFPTRLGIGIMLFTACWVTYMQRVNISVNIIAMVADTKGNTTVKASMCVSPVKTTNTSSPVNEHEVRDSKMGYFDWSPKQQSLILGAYFWGYLVTSLMGGPASERWGSRQVVGITTILNAVLTALSVPAAFLHWGALVGVRFLIGISGGFTYPALHALVARWAPPSEKGKFVSALMGGTLGTVVTWSLTGPIIEALNWQAAFYIPAGLSLLWAIVWYYVVYDTPDQHPRITDDERKYINEALADKIQNKKMVPPLRSIFTSIPFLAMVVLHYGNTWGLYFIMTAAPIFMSSVLGFNIKTAGAISSLPYLARLIMAFIFGAIGDLIVKRHLMSTTALRKWFTICSHILPGLLMVAILFVGCSTSLIVFFITVSMGWNGAATLTNLTNHQDLAPNFAGTLYGIANFVGGTAGFITPLIVAHFTSDGNQLENWRPVFFIGASVYVISALFFMFFGSGDIQPWNFVTDEAVSENSKRNVEGHVNAAYIANKDDITK